MCGSNPKSRSSAGGRLAVVRFPAAALALLALLLSACAPGKNNGSAEKGAERQGSEAAVLRISQRNEPGDLDPALAAIPDDYFVIRALSEGLVSPAPDGSGVVAAAADHWTVSEDGRSYYFHLRGDARWSDGSPVTADDFIASFKRALEPSTPAPKVHLFFPVKGARRYHEGKERDFSKVGFSSPSPNLLRVTLERPLPEFLAYAASGPWIPVNIPCVVTHGKAWTRPENYVGNGPFSLVEWQPHKRIVVKRKDAYWDARNVWLKEIRLLAFDNGEAEERAFRAGQIDVTMSVPPTKLAGYQTEEGGVLRRAPLQETRYLSFNTQKAPLNDPRVRRALALSVDRNAIAEKVLHGGQPAARRFLPAGLAPAGQVLEMAENIEAAKGLLAAAGYPEGKGFPLLELSGWTNVPVLEAVQAMWRKNLGIEVSLATRDAKVHIAALQEGRYDIAFVTAIPDAADGLLQLADFRPGAPANYAHWSDETYATLLDRAENATAPQERNGFLLAAENRLLDQAPLAPLYFNTRNYLVRPEVQGWNEDGLWNRFYKKVSVETTRSQER